ncbi:helix-turn-helix domain-containing protein [Taklimakanibacter lacteus]|uniref:helix-turn-helix domain-containing protein n=1 Tax=Taklimakanibacter lacteus TaxID=2268456 RepID=UPI000E669D4D
MADETHGFVNMTSFAVHRTSAGLAWPSAFMSVQTESPYAGQFDAIDGILISLIESGRVDATVRFPYKTATLHGRPGGVSIVPNDIAFAVESQSRARTTHLYIRRSVVDDIAMRMHHGDPDNIAILPTLAAYDPVLEQLCGAIRHELASDPKSSGIYVETLTYAAAAHLLRRYSSLGHPQTQPANLRRLGSQHISRAQEMIRSRFEERLTLKDLSAGTGVTADHFLRLFKLEAGVTPYQFLIRCRIDHARRLLAQADESIAVIAQQCGFSDQAHLTKAFRRLTGTTPAAFRKANGR